MAKKVRGATIKFSECGVYFGRIPLYELNETEDFVNDRHWGNGRYWIGWRPVPDERGAFSEAAMRQWQYVCESFTQKNVIGSNLNRLEGAILGNEPDFDVISANPPEPLADLQAESLRQKTSDEKFYDDIDDKIVDWWTHNGVHQTFKDLLRAKASNGKFAILTYIPSGYLEEKEVEVQTDAGLVKQKVFAFSNAEATFEDVLRYIKVEVIHYSQFIDVKDADFGTTFTIAKLTPQNDSAKGLMERYGIFYVDTDNRSYFRILNADETDDAISCDLSGNNLCLTYGDYEKTLVTPSVKKLQKAVNHAETGSNYALANINYPETTFINAMPIEKSDDAGNATGIKVQPKQGMGVFRYLFGVTTETINGQNITTPAIHERNGADPEKFSKESEKKSRDIDMLMGMGYKHLADSEYASGNSKAKSMDDLDILLTDYETSINTAGTKVIENVIRLAFNFTNQTNKNKDFNVLFRVNVSQGKITNDDKSGMREEVAAGLRSEENYMLIAKVSDNPKVEKRRILAQPPKPVADGTVGNTPKTAPALPAKANTSGK